MNLSLYSNATSHYSPYNYGEQETQLPGAPSGPYTQLIDNLPDTDPNPNGVWELYIYDDKMSDMGALERSWSLEFYYDP